MSVPRAAAPTVPMLALAIGFASGAACAGHANGHLAAPPAPWVGAQVPAVVSRERLLTETGEAVWRGDLATAEVALTALADRERGQPDSALDFWSEMLALLRCEPLARVPRVSPAALPLRDPWVQLRRLVQIERVRLSRALPEPPKAGRMMARSDGQAKGPGAATPGTTQVTTQVTKRSHLAHRERALERRAAGSRARDPLPPRQSDSFSAGAAMTSAPAADAEIALVAGTAGLLPPEHPATAPLLLQAAVLEMAHGRAAPAVATLARFDAVGGARDNVLALRERSDAIFTDALAAITDPAVAPDLAMEKSRAAFRLDLPASVRRSLALLLADRLVAAKRPDDAVAILGAPPHGDDRDRPLHRLPSGRGARARRPSRRAVRRGARGAAPAWPRRRRGRSGARRHDGHGAAHPGGVAGLVRDDGDAGGARPPARAALPRPGVRRDGARRWRVTPRRWRPSAGSTTTTPTPSAGCSTWRTSLSRPPAPARGPSSRGPSCCWPVKKRPPRARRRLR